MYMPLDTLDSTRSLTNDKTIETLENDALAKDKKIEML